MEQIAFDGFVTCDRCEYGRSLGANDYGCRNEIRRNEKQKLVNKADYNCEYAKVKE